MHKIQKLDLMLKSTKEKQSVININEVWYAWDILVAKYDAISISNIVVSHIEDTDLKLVSGSMVNLYKDIIKLMEGLLTEFGIPMPERPRERVKSTVNVEILNDKYIFNVMFEIVQSVIPVAASSFSKSTAPYVRSKFKTILFKNVNLFEELVEYGKLKNYLDKPPVYRP